MVPETVKRRSGSLLEAAGMVLTVVTLVVRWRQWLA